MEVGSADIMSSAQSFNNNAKLLEQEAKKRQLRLYLILAVMTLAILLYIIVPLASGDDEE
jgi:hypothetical protein